MQNNDLISRKALIEAIDNIDWYSVKNGKLTPGAVTFTGLFKATDINYAVETAPTVDALIPPCKPWDNVWIIDTTLDHVNGGLKKTICGGEIYKLSYNGFTTPMEWIDYRWDSPLVGQTTRHDRIDLCLGKTVFLTREEAEAALAERNKE